MEIYLISEPKSSWAYLKSFHPFISRLAWLWLSHPIFLTHIMWEVSHHWLSCVLSPVSRGSCSIWLGRESPEALLSLFTFWNGNQSLKDKAGVLKCSWADFAVTQTGRYTGGTVRRQMQHLHLGFWKPLIYTVGSLSCPCVRRCLRVKMILSQCQKIDVSE